MPSAKIGWAVVGLGQQGERLAKAIAASGQELVATASERQRGSFAAALRNPKVDAIAVATPNERTWRRSLPLRKRESMCCAKSRSRLPRRTAERCDRRCAKANVRCFVNYHLRMHEEVQRARAVIESGKLGDITHIEMHWSVGGLAGKPPPLPPHMAWREDPKRAGGGALTARGTHLFDLLRFLTGAEPTVARAFSDATPRLVDRTAVGVLLVKTTPAVITTSKAVREADNRIVFYGTKKKLIIRDIFLADPQRLYEAVFKAFADELRGKKTALATIDDGLAAIALTEAFAAAVREIPVDSFAQACRQRRLRLPAGMLLDLGYVGEPALDAALPRILQGKFARAPAGSRENLLRQSFDGKLVARADMIGAAVGDARLHDLLHRLDGILDVAKGARVAGAGERERVSTIADTCR